MILRFDQFASEAHGELLSGEILLAMAEADVDIPKTEKQRVTNSVELAIPMFYARWDADLQGTEANSLPNCQVRCVAADATLQILRWTRAHGLRT